MFFERGSLMWLRFFICTTMESRENIALFIGNSKCYGLRETDVEQAIIKAIVNIGSSGSFIRLPF